MDLRLIFDVLFRVKLNYEWKVIKFNFVEFWICLLSLLIIYFCDKYFDYIGYLVWNKYNVLFWLKNNCVILYLWYI